MPSGRLLSPPPAPPHRAVYLLTLLAGVLTTAFSCLLLLVLCFRRISRKSTALSLTTSDTNSTQTPFSLSYSLLRRATSNFSPSLRLGQGGFGSVYRGELKPGPHGSEDSVLAVSLVAVKLMDSGSLQGEREFQNELLFASKIDCKYIIPVLGFSSNPSKHRILLIYELMENGSLQDCLFHKKSDELRNWDKRFSIALHIARGLEHLHHHCQPPIIHGDIKPSNILLDRGFNAKISDFGLAKFKLEDNAILEGELKNESTSSTNGLEESNKSIHHNLDKSPQSVIIRVDTSPEVMVASELSPEAGPVVSPKTVADMVSPCEGLDKMMVWEWSFDRLSVDGEHKSKKKPKNEWIHGTSLSKSGEKKAVKNKNKWRHLDRWLSLDDEKDNKKNKKQPAREWWREEHQEELEKKKTSPSRSPSPNTRWSSKFGTTIEWWLAHRLGGDLQKARKNNSYDSPNSRGISSSSTPSMRGTVCYIAPEYGGGGADVSEKSDVYSYGVLLLVLIAGRRPLQLTGSPMSEFQRANLLSWARHLVRAEKPLDLVDDRIHRESLDSEQALLCITVALLCLHKSPARRPSMREVVGMLLCELAYPQLPLEIPSKSQKVRDSEVGTTLSTS